MGHRWHTRAVALGNANPVVGEESGDAVGRVETHGVDYIPEADRKSHPRNLAWAMFGPQFGFGNMFFGSLVIVFGLGWWSAVTAIVVGTTLGSLIFAGMAIMAPKSGTNNADHQRRVLRHHRALPRLGAQHPDRARASARSSSGPQARRSSTSWTRIVGGATGIGGARC